MDAIEVLTAQELSRGEFTGAVESQVQDGGADCERPVHTAAWNGSLLADLALKRLRMVMS